MQNSDTQRIMQNALRKLQQGKPQAAAKAALAGLKRFPTDQNLLKLAGTALTQTGDHRATAKVYSDLYKLTPQILEVQMSFGISLVHAGRFDLARKLATEWLDAEPDNPNFRYLLAVIATGIKEFEIAEFEATKALDTKPTMDSAMAIRGLARFELRCFESALDDFQRLNAHAPDRLETLLNIGFCYRSLQQDAKAIETFQKCVDLFPGDVAARINLATSLEQSGELQGALAEFKTVLETAPGNWASISRIVELNSQGQNQTFEPHVRKHLRSVRKGSEDEITATMALANLLTKNNNWPEAEQFYQRSNGLQATARPYHPTQAEARLAETLGLFPSDHAPRPGGDLSMPRPIFVIGQPRSGTTLMEMIISSHPDVIGLGEFGAIEDVAHAALTEGVSNPEQHAKTYRSELPRDVDRFDAFIDKMPGNYMFVGFLAEAFPEAKFIHIARDPREVAFSMWKRHFAGDLTTYTSDFGWMAHAANTYQRYMLRWDDLFSSQILTVNYRDMVRDTENISRKVSGFCDLEWHVSMAEPERNKTTVRSASVVQVRQKIHGNSLGLWEQHATLLRPFTEQLDIGLWPEID